MKDQKRDHVSNRRNDQTNEPIIEQTNDPILDQEYDRKEVLSQPRIDAESLYGVLREHYGIEADAVVEQQGGWAALAYRVEDAGSRYFLKVYEKRRASTAKWTAQMERYIPVLHWLQTEGGLHGCVPTPLATRSGQLRCEDDDAIYLLYQYIAGETIAERDLDERQVKQLATIVATLHSYGREIVPDADAMTEQFQVPFVAWLPQLLQDDAGLPADVQAVVAPYRAAVTALLQRVAAQAERLKQEARPFVLCHMDLHHWNLMDNGERLIVIDWEGLTLAPPEADWMFIREGTYEEAFLEQYRTIRPDVQIDPFTLSFYAGRRKIEDIGEFLEQLLVDNQAAKERDTTLRQLQNELESL